MPGKASGKPFAKGDPRAGRPKGSPNKTTVEVRAMAQGLIEDPEYQDKLRARLLDSSLPPAVEVLLWHFAFGKPAESVRLSGPDGGPVRSVVIYVPGNGREASSG